MRSVNHRIEVLRGELHDYKYQNNKFGRRIETLENELKRSLKIFNVKHKKLKRSKLLLKHIQSFLRVH